MENTQAHWEERYQESNLPWDSGITPPEVVAFWQSEWVRSIPAAAKVLDIGCGTGTNLAYLARLGHDATGIELSGNALAIATGRHVSIAYSLRQRISMIHGSAALLPFWGAGFDYILDIGCLHGIPLNERVGYAEGVVKNLQSGGFYQLYGFDKAESEVELETGTGENESELGRGLGENEVEELLGDQMAVVSIEQATPNPRPCRWYLFQKE